MAINAIDVIHAPVMIRGNATATATAGAPVIGVVLHARINHSRIRTVSKSIMIK